MATNQEKIDLAMSRLGQRSSTRLRADVLSEINATINRLEQEPFIPWFLQKTTQFSFAASKDYKDLPSDYLMEAEDSRPYRLDDQGVAQYFSKRFIDVLFGEATEYYKYYAIDEENSRFYIRKIATEAITVNFRYYAKETGNITDDATAVSNKWLLTAQDWILHDALARVSALHIRDMEGASIHQGLASAAKTEIYKHHIARSAENQDFEVGGISDGS